MSPKFSQFSTLDGDVESFYVQQPYVLTFSKTAVDVWRIGAQNQPLEHSARLSDFVAYPPPGLNPIIDIERSIVVIPDRGSGSPLLWVFSLTDGRLIRKPELYGSLARVPLQYTDGKVLAAVEEDEDGAPPDGLTTLLLCDVAGEDWLLGVGGVLVPIVLRPNGDIIATSSEAWHDKMDVLRWRGPDIPNFPEPDASFELAVSLEDGDCIHPMCSAPLGENSFLLAVYEADSGALPKGGGCQTTIYAIDSDAMTIRWRAEPIGGAVREVHYVAALDVVVAFGRHDNGDAQEADPFTFILVLDPATGTRRKMETIIHRIQGSPVQHCELSRKADAFALVVVFRDASMCLADLRQFLEQGFPEEGERLATTRLMPEGSTVEAVGVIERMVIVSVNDASGPSHIQCVSFD